jgi:hypothetical protein
MVIKGQSLLIFGQITFIVYSTKMDGSQDLNVGTEERVATNQHQEGHELERKD